MPTSQSATFQELAGKAPGGSDKTLSARDDLQSASPFPTLSLWIPTSLIRAYVIGHKIPGIPTLG